MLYQDQLQEIMSCYENKIEWFIQRLASAPKGSLICQPNHGQLQFLQLYRENGKRIRRSITHNEPLKRALAQKEFARKALEILEPNVTTLRGAIEHIIPFDPDEILRSMTKGYTKLPEEYFFDRDLHQSLMVCQPPVVQRAQRISTGWKNSLIRRARSVSSPNALICSTYWLMLPGKIST